MRRNVLRGTALNSPLRRPPLGAHMSIAGGLHKALERGEQFIEVDGTTVLLPQQQGELLIQAMQEAEPDSDSEADTESEEEA